MGPSVADHRPAGASLKSRALSGAAWMLVEMIGVQATSFAVFAVIAHFVTPRDFGLMSVSFLAVQSLQMVLLYNVSVVAVRKQQVENLDFTTAFWITICLAAFCFLALFAASASLQSLFKAPGLKPILRAMSVVLLFMGLSRTHETWLIRHLHLKALAMRGLAGAIAGGIAGVVLAIYGFGVEALVGQQVINAIVTTVLLWSFCPWRPVFRFSIASAREVLAFMRSILPTSLVYAVNQNGDTFMVALFFGPVSAGFYNVGKRIRLALQLVAGEPIKNITLPTLAEMQDDPVRLRRALLNSLTLICLVCAPMFFGAAAVSHAAISVVFGQKWLGAVPVMQLLTIGGFAMVVLAYNDNFFILRDRPSWCLLVSVSYSLLAVVAVVFCIELNIRTLALPFVLPYLIVLPLSVFLFAQRGGLSWTEIIGAMLPGIGSAAIMFVILRLVESHLSGFDMPVQLGMLCAIGGLAYCMILLAFWPSSARMLRDILLHLKRERST